MLFFFAPQTGQRMAAALTQNETIIVWKNIR